MNILLTHTPDAVARYYGEEALAALREHGLVHLNQSSKPFDTADLIREAQGCEVIIADRQTPVQRAAFEALPDLVAVLRCAVDISNIDVGAANEHGVLVTRASAGFMDSVAELAIGLMVDLARGVSDAVCAYRASKAAPIRMGVQLSASTVGIIGYGAIGRRLGLLAQALRMKVLASDPARQVEDAGIEQVGFQDLLARSQFVICLAPAVPTTRNMMNDEAFAAMPAGSFFINLSRSSLVDEDALERALDSGHLSGAALDVGSAPDQMPPVRLARRHDVIATPHIGGLTPQAVAHQAFDTVRQAAALARGEPPPLAVNLQQASRLSRFQVPST